MYAERYPMFEITKEEAEILRDVRDHVSPNCFYLCVRISLFYPHAKSLIWKIEDALCGSKTLRSWLLTEHRLNFLSMSMWKFPEVEAEHRRRWIDALLAQHEEVE